MWKAWLHRHKKRKRPAAPIIKSTSFYSTADFTDARTAIISSLSRNGRAMINGNARTRTVYRTFLVTLLHGAFINFIVTFP